MNENNNSHLPFTERFKPRKLEDIISHKENINILKKYIKQYNVPHLLFYGPSGTGKTSTSEVFVHELYGENVNFMTMRINASEERGIEIVRNKIKNFISTMPIYNIDNEKIPKYKFIILDEADAMTFNAQAMLKQIIEKYTFNSRFCLICNCIKKINPAIQSRCSVFKFTSLDFFNVKKKILSISKKNNINITNDGIKTIWKISRGDIRKIINTLQVIVINNNTINSETVSIFKKYPSKKNINIIYKCLMDGKLNNSLLIVKENIFKNNYYLRDIIDNLTELIVNDIIKKKINQDKGIKILINLRDIEINIIHVSETNTQINAMIAIFTNINS